jgi:hypothetical protein
VNRLRIVALAQLLGIAAVLAILAWRHPTELPIPSCPSRMLGLYCPGCGSTRATHLLLRGEFAAAWRHNPGLVVVGVPALAIYVVGLLLALCTGRSIRVLPFGPATAAWFGAILVTALVAWAVVRNLPGPAFDRFRPPPISVR